jgi:serine phosphatase RsbU (regulator of sigma subunit)/anti-sigma regulatory factor (Ser/Thr protein kinase)
MATLIRNLRQSWPRKSGQEAQQEAVATSIAQRSTRVTPAVDIGPNDPLVAYFLTSTGAVELEHIRLESPALEALRAAGVKLAVPLVSQGELIGLLSLGPRLSEQDYSTDDRALLNNLATQAAPAVKVAQLVQQQQAETRERERTEQELRVARLIQQTLLPKELPALPGWDFAAYYQPARAVGGDFYDFIALQDGRLGIVIGDVTDKGVPAALVMATTRAILRSAATELAKPGEVLEKANEMLYPDIPPNMFVTCLYAVLDPVSGKLQYANAGHDLPYRRRSGDVVELRAIGMPLGLMPGMHYEEQATVLAPGECVLFYSDGIVEAHNAHREMFSFPHLREVLARSTDSGFELLDHLLEELARFTGDSWEQEDDVTLVTLQRTGHRATTPADHTPYNAEGSTDTLYENWEVLTELAVQSAPGNERVAMEGVEEAVSNLLLDKRKLDKLKTAVAEATMNAMEHGNRYDPDKPVSIQVCRADGAVSVRITDQGGTPLVEAQTPDLRAKLAGDQTPRGWGLFLIKNLVDDMHVSSDDAHHTVELVMYLGGEKDARENS